MRSFAWILVVLMLVAVSSEVDARGRRRGGNASSSSTGSHMDYAPSKESTDKKYHGNTKSLQDIAMERAAAMALAAVPVGRA